MDLDDIFVISSGLQSVIASISGEDVVFLSHILIWC